MKHHKTKIKLLKTAKHSKGCVFTRSESAFAIKMIRATPVTADRLVAAQVRASRARDAETADFLDQYRVKAVA